MGKMKKFEMLNLICKDCELTAKEKLVAQYFVYKSNKAGACYPCVDVIAEQCSVSRRTVQRATKKLAEKEYILIEKRFKFGRQTSNLYSFNILLLEERRRNEELDRQATNDIEETECLHEEIEIIEFEELFNDIPNDDNVDGLVEIDLDLLVNNVDEEEWTNTLISEQEENNEEYTSYNSGDAIVHQEIEDSQKQCIVSKVILFSIAKVMTWLLWRFYLISQCNIVIVEITWLPFKIAIYVRGNNGTYTISRASSNIKGAFFPP